MVYKSIFLSSNLHYAFLKLSVMFIRKSLDSQNFVLLHASLSYSKRKASSSTSSDITYQLPWQLGAGLVIHRICTTSLFLSLWIINKRQLRYSTSRITLWWLLNAFWRFMNGVLSAGQPCEYMHREVYFQ